MCRARFSTTLTLDCTHDGLVAIYNNELNYGVSELAGKDFVPLHVHNKPFIHTGCSMGGMKTPTTWTLTQKNQPQVADEFQKKGYLLI